MNKEQERCLSCARCIRVPISGYYCQKKTVYLYGRYENTRRVGCKHYEKREGQPTFGLPIEEVKSNG